LLEAAESDANERFDVRPFGLVIEPCRDGSTEKNPHAGTKAGAGGTTNRIDIEFDPSLSKKVKKCEKIVHVQFTRRFADGKKINVSEFDSRLAYKDKYTIKKGWCLDFLSGEVTPDYQQGVGEGSKNGSTTSATMTDIPDYSVGGDQKGFYDPISNKVGFKRIVLKFVAYAWCMKGPDCGKWYGGVKWEYVVTWKDVAAGRKGTAKKKGTTSSGPSKEQLRSLDLFNKDNGFVPCT
jgi:hypothetical protein